MGEYDCIDSCIVLGILFQESIGELQEYIRTVGYKQRNKGLLTVYLMGEIFTNLFTKICQKVEDGTIRAVLLQNALDFFEDVIMELLRQDRLIIAKIQNSDYQLIRQIQELDYAITDDDALHLSCAVNNQCQRFVTTDTILLSENCRSRIRREFGLIISRP